MVENTHSIVVVEIERLIISITIQPLYKQIGKLLIFWSLLVIEKIKKYLTIFGSKCKPHYSYNGVCSS